MSITEASRHQLHTKLATLLGSEDATVLMEHLPPIGWADVATKRDLDHLETVLRADFDVKITALSTELQRELAAVRVDIHQLQASFTRQLLLANTALIGIFAGMLRLMG